MPGTFVRMDATQFNNIKNDLDAGFSISACQRKYNRGWSTIKAVENANSFSEYGNVVVDEQPVFEPVEVRTEPDTAGVTLVDQLREKQAEMNTHFNRVIESLERN